MSLTTKQKVALDELARWDESHTQGIYELVREARGNADQALSMLAADLDDWKDQWLQQQREELAELQVDQDEAFDQYKRTYLAVSQSRLPGGSRAGRGKGDAVFNPAPARHATSRPMVMFHGSPYAGICKFTDVRPPVFFTKHFEVAKQYAEGMVFGTGRAHRAFTKRPTIYTVELGELAIADFRSADVRREYMELRKHAITTPAFNAEDLPRSLDDLLQSRTSLPGYGNARPLSRLLAIAGYEAAWIDEGSQDISLMVFRGLDKLTITKMESLPMRNPAAAALDVPCPTCRVGRRTPCIVDRGSRYKTHLARQDKADEESQRRVRNPWDAETKHFVPELGMKVRHRATGHEGWIKKMVASAGVATASIGPKRGRDVTFSAPVGEFDQIDAGARTPPGWERAFARNNPDATGRASTFEDFDRVVDDTVDWVRVPGPARPALRPYLMRLEIEEGDPAVDRGFWAGEILNLVMKHAKAVGLPKPQLDALSDAIDAAVENVMGMDWGGPRRRLNPARKNPDAPGLEEGKAKFEEFHRYEHRKVGEFAKGFRVPSTMLLAGPAIHVTYESAKIDPSTLRKPRNPVAYIHEHDAGVKLYVPAAMADELDLDPDATTRVPFAAAGAADATLVCLGNCLGYKFQLDGKPVEAESVDPLPELYCTPDGKCLLVIQSKRDVLAMMWGGALGVFARGIDG